METVRKGSRGETVKTLQKALGITADGIFGANTEAKAKEFQRSKGLDDDGIVGKNTWEALLGSPKAKLDEAKIREIIAANSKKLTSGLNNKNDKQVTYDQSKHLIVVAVRGYKPEMGGAGNDRRIYDDAHFIVTPKGVVMFDGNTDPNGFRKGHGTGSSKGMAMLNEGVWFYGKGPHNGRPSFRQCAPVQVTRDGNPPYLDFGWFGINWHSGGDVSTSSLGCQTNRPNDYAKLRDYIYKELDVFDNPKMNNDWSEDPVRAFPYILIDMENINKGKLVV